VRDRGQPLIIEGLEDCLALFGAVGETASTDGPTG
jgi:hypothetical protein